MKHISPQGSDCLIYIIKNCTPIYWLKKDKKWHFTECILRSNNTKEIHIGLFFSKSLEI